MFIKAVRVKKERYIIELEEWEGRTEK